MMYAPLAAALVLTAAAPIARAQQIGQNFTGSSRAQSGFIPPDTMGAVGPDHFVELINGRFAVYEKNALNNPNGTRTPILATTLNGFWSSAGVTPQGSFAFDPRILYDPNSGRWFASSVDNIRSNNNFLIAVSNTSDPTAGWTGFAIDSDTTNQRWADFPQLGFDADGVYLTANMFPITTGTQQTTVLAIPKADLLAPAPHVSNFRLLENHISTTGTSAQPVVSLDNSNLPAAFWSGSTEFFLRSNLNGPLSAPTLSSAGGTTVSERADPPTADQADNFSTGSQTPKANINTLDLRFTANVVLQQGVYWGVQTVAELNRAALRWFKIRASDNELLQEGILTAPGRSFYFGSIAVNEFGDVVIGCTGSGSTLFASSFAFVGDSMGDSVIGETTFGSALLLKAGVDDYEVLDSAGRNRWGDYSATTLDPSDPFSFWTIQEFVSADNQYSLQVTQIAIPEPGIGAVIMLMGMLPLRRR